MKKLIVFDLDHTLLKHNCSYAFGHYLYGQNKLNFSQLCVCLTAYIRHKWLGFSLQNLHQLTFDCLFKDFSISQLQQLVHQFLDENFHSLLNLPVIERLKEAQQQEETVILLSSSPDFLVEALAERLKIAHWGATVYQVNLEKKLSHLSFVMGGKEKANYLSHHLHQHELPSSIVTVYSDSYLDLPLLKMAGQVIGVKPDRRLKHLCHQNQWEIL